MTYGLRSAGQLRGRGPLGEFLAERDVGAADLGDQDVPRSSTTFNVSWTSTIWLSVFASCTEARRGRETRRVLPGSARRCSVDPGWVHEDDVAAVWAIGADGDQLEAVVSGFERPHRRGVDANDIPAAELADLVVESDLSGAADDDIGLLLFAVAMRRR